MDIESFRQKKVKDFIESLGLVYCTKWKAFMRDLGVSATEELKLVTEDEWNSHFETLSITKIQMRKLKIALGNLATTGPVNVSMNMPLPIKK